MSEHDPLEAAVKILTDRLYADPQLGPGYMLRDDCEHIARRVLIALRAEPRASYQWMNDARTVFAADYVAREIPVAERGLRRYVLLTTRIPSLVTDWTPVPEGSDAA